MTPLVLHCTYPFPKDGIKCPACNRIQKKPSLFNLHARNVHHTLATETPTICSACGRSYNSYKAASAHYSRAHLEIRKKKPKSPSPPPSQTQSPPPSLLTQDDSPPSPPQQTDPAPEDTNSRPPSLSLSLQRRKLQSPPSTPVQLSPSESTQDIMRRFLQDIPPPAPPTITTSSAKACTPTQDTFTLSSWERPIATPAPPIPVQSRRSILPSPTSPVAHFIHSIRQAGSPTLPAQSTDIASPPPPPQHNPSTTAVTLNRKLTMLKEALHSADTSSSASETSVLSPSSSQSPPPTPMTDTPATTQPPTSPLTHHTSPPRSAANPLPADDDPPPPHQEDASDIDLPGPQDEHLTQFHDHWSSVFSSNLSWEDFSEQCLTFAEATRTLAIQLSKPTPTTRPPAQRPNPNLPRRPPNGRPVPRFDPAEAKRIQGLYRHSKKRAARKILCNNRTTYTGSKQDAQDFFTNIFASKPCDTSAISASLQQTIPACDEEASHLYSDMTSTEIASKLRSASNTSPGPDRVEYQHLKRVDPNAKLLSLIFNRCLAQRDVPAAWKDALTILIHKRGDPDNAANFRPIALMSCTYKLLMGVIAKRVSTWAIEQKLLSDEQKSARPSEGCYEHTYLLQSILNDARRNQRTIFIAWLDLRNAFGSLPHDAIKTTLTHIGVPDQLVTLIANAYTGATTSILAGNTKTDPIPLLAGVKQGCPLSPILFNLCLELVLRAVKQRASALPRNHALSHFESPISCLAYADDLVIVARKSTALQTLLDSASSAATVLGLEFRPEKCATLALINTKGSPARVEQHEFRVQDHVIPSLTRQETYRYLGVPIGLVQSVEDLDTILPQLIEDLDAIRSSLLAPWQKLDAIRVFIQPCLTYALRAGDPHKKDLTSYRRALVTTVRDICNLPTRSTQAYLFAHKSAGGLALQDPWQEVDIQTVVQAVRMLSSNDPLVTSVAHAELKSIVRRSTSSQPSNNLISKYLSGARDGPLAKLNYAKSSLWSRCRLACHRLGITFRYTENAPPTVTVDDTALAQSKTISSFLHRIIQQRTGKSLMDLQGKVARCLATDDYGNGSCWHNTGLNLRFRDWRFVHKARLNVLPVNAVKARWSNTAPTCRHCEEAETLPHVLCHCRPDLVHIRSRHNQLVSRLTTATRFGNITTDRAIQESGLPLRPDIVIEEEDRTLIIDVTCPFDNGPDALEEAARAKISKYEPLKTHFVNLGKQCEILPFVVGALGSWYPPNEHLLNRLGMTRRYKTLFRKLCCADAIQGSCNIYRLHMGWDVAI